MEQKPTDFHACSRFSTIGDRVDKRTKKMNKKSLAALIDIDELDKRVQEVSKEKLSQENKETITLYLTPPKDSFDEIDFGKT